MGPGPALDPPARTRIRGGWSSPPRGPAPARPSPHEDPRLGPGAGPKSVRDQSRINQTWNLILLSWRRTLNSSSRGYITLPTPLRLAERTRRILGRSLVTLVGRCVSSSRCHTFSRCACWSGGKSRTCIYSCDYVITTGDYEHALCSRWDGASRPRCQARYTGARVLAEAQQSRFQHDF